MVILERMTDPGDHRRGSTARRHAEPSNTKIDKAGRSLRNWLLDNSEVTDAERDQAIETVLAYRDTFARSLEIATDAIRSALGESKIDFDVTVASRPKTLVSIALKLSKLSSRLTQIEDIAGCRVVLPELADVYGFLDAPSVFGLKRSLLTRTSNRIQRLDTVRFTSSQT